MDMSESTNSFDIEDILEFLPHRYPFLLVDRIVEFEKDRRIVGIKNVTINEPFFQGHFPGSPVMPGVLIIESMAQVGGFLVFKTLSEREGKLVYFMGIEHARFRKPVRPGDQLRMEMFITRAGKRVGKLKGKAFVDGQVVAEGDLIFSLVDRLQPESSSRR